MGAATVDAVEFLECEFQCAEVICICEQATAGIQADVTLNGTFTIGGRTTDDHTSLIVRMAAARSLMRALSSFTITANGPPYNTDLSRSLNTLGFPSCPSLAQRAFFNKQPHHLNHIYERTTTITTKVHDDAIYVLFFSFMISLPRPQSSGRR